MLKSKSNAAPPKSDRVPVSLRNMSLGDVLHEAELIMRKQSSLSSCERRMVVARAREILGGER
jgi:hypothetical protein